MVSLIPHDLRTRAETAALLEYLEQRGHDTAAALVDMLGPHWRCDACGEATDDLLVLSDGDVGVRVCRACDDAARARMRVIDGLEAGRW